MKQIQQIDNIVNSGFKIARIETARHDSVINLFNQYCAKAKQHLYLWQQSGGLHRLSGKQLPINNTRLITEALDFVQTAPEFGIYILRDFPEKYPVRVSYQLQEIIAHQSNNNALIILLGDNLPMDPMLSQYMLTVQCGNNPVPVAQQKPLASPASVGQRVGNSRQIARQNPFS